MKTLGKLLENIIYKKIDLERFFIFTYINPDNDNEY